MPRSTFRGAPTAVKIAWLTIVAAGMCGVEAAAAQAKSSCPPKQMLRVIHGATRAHVIRLGSRAGRVEDPLDESGRFLGFERLRVIEIESARIKPLIRAFENSESYACEERSAAKPLPVQPVQIGFVFESVQGRVALVLLQPEQLVQMEYSNGAYAEAAFSERGASLWEEALKNVLAPGERPTEFYDSMRAPRAGPGGPSAAEPAQHDTTGDAACAQAPEQDLQAARRVPPEYPDLARSAGVDGEVHFRVLVGPDGRVRRTQIVKSIPMLDAAAEAAVRQWRFVPATRDGSPVCAWTAVPVVFTLH